MTGMAIAALALLACGIIAESPLLTAVGVAATAATIAVAIWQGRPR